MKSSYIPKVSNIFSVSFQSHEKLINLSKTIQSFDRVFSVKYCIKYLIILVSSTSILYFIIFDLKNNNIFMDPTLKMNHFFKQIFLSFIFVHHHLSYPF